MQVTFVPRWGWVGAGGSRCPLLDLCGQCADFFSFSGMQCGITAGWIAELWTNGPVNDIQAETGWRRCGLQAGMSGQLWFNCVQNCEATGQNDTLPASVTLIFLVKRTLSVNEAARAWVRGAKKPEVHFHTRPLDGPFTQDISLHRLSPPPPPPFSLALAPSPSPLSSSLPTKWMTAFRNTRVRHDSEARTLCHLCSTCFDASATREAEGMGGLRRTGRGGWNKRDRAYNSTKSQLMLPDDNVLKPQAP